MSITPFPNGVSSFGAVLASPLFPGLTTRVGRHYFVDTVNGNNGRNGRSPDRAFATIRAGLNAATTGNGDTIWVFPGQYAESLTIDKLDVAIIGASGKHPGRTQIIGDGVTAQATIDVNTGFARGFVLANVEVDTNSVARPAIRVVTNEAGDRTATSTDAYWTLQNVRVNSGNATLPSAALLLEGAQMGRVYNSELMNCTHGVVFQGGVTNQPDDVKFWNTVYQDNVTADVATSASAAGTTTAFTLGTLNGLTNVQFFHSKYMDRGGTPVTNYVNVAVTTAVNCGDYGFYAARDVADATLMALPADWIAIGWSAAAAEFIIGA